MNELVYSPTFPISFARDGPSPMSSPIPRSGDEAREDEIDLGDEDGELTRTTNGEFEHDVPSIPDEPGREETDGHLLTPRRAPTSHLDNNNPDSTALSLPGVDESTRPLSLRSLEDSASLPDDTPSLHVGDSDFHATQDHRKCTLIPL